MSVLRAAVRLGAAVLLLGVLGLGGPNDAKAQIGGERYAAIVTNAGDGRVLFEAHADELRHPASLTKMMTIYMAFEAMRDGRITLDTVIRVSDNAADQAPSRLGLVTGMSLTVEDAIFALITKSANDAAAALGELIGQGSEARFAQMMTLRARALGMRSTVFRNASGLPDIEQVTTARDMALLGRRLMHDFPDRFSYFSATTYRWRGRILYNHNRLLGHYEGADGIKTGYVNHSGFNLVASARRDGVRLVAAVFGGRTGAERDRHMMALLDQGFATMGVAPRAVMANRNTPQVLPGASAATTQGRPPATAARRPGSGGPFIALQPPAQARMVATRPAAPSLRVPAHAAARRPQHTLAAPVRTPQRAPAASQARQPSKAPVVITQESRRRSS